MPRGSVLSSASRCSKRTGSAWGCRQKSGQFGAAIAAESDNTNGGTHGYLFTDLNNYTKLEVPDDATP